MIIKKTKEKREYLAEQKKNHISMTLFYII